nr:(d)CMP kinase [Croceicoccus bisphenolivorans]
MLIAVDGTIGSGKKVVARAIARHFGLPYLSTGLHYRAVAYQVMLNGGSPDLAGDALAACDFPLEMLEEPELQAEYIGGFASRLASHADVREVLFKRQWKFAHRKGGCVLDGRDIGTVIAPDADAKLFLHADFAARLSRIHNRYLEREDPISLAEIAVDIMARDERDQTRTTAPLMRANDALLLDTSSLNDAAAAAEGIRIVSDHLAQMSGTPFAGSVDPPGPAGAGPAAPPA